MSVMAECGVLVTQARRRDRRQARSIRAGDMDGDRRKVRRQESSRIGNREHDHASNPA
jgi:hypothetical protein